MSAQISYKKQTVLVVMLLFGLLAPLAGITEIYYYFIPICQYGASEASMHLSLSERHQICSDFRAVKSDFQLGYRQLVPNQHYATININDHGFRGPDFSAQKPSDTYRIFVLGGSTVFGSGSTSDDTAIPGYLQTMYDAHDLPFEVEVINAGIGGVTSHTEHKIIKNNLIKMDPDLFIIYDGWNDAVRHPDNPGIDHEAHLKIMEGKLTLDERVSKIKEERSFKNIYRDLGMARWVVDIRDNFLHLNSPKVRVIDDTSVDEKVSIWAERWNEICKLGNENGFDAMVIVQPALGSGNYTLSEPEMEHYRLSNSKILIERLAHYAGALPRLDSCTATADMRNVLDDATRSIFLDWVHLNDYGNEIVASAIFEKSYPIVEQWEIVQNPNLGVNPNTPVRVKG